MVVGFYLNGYARVCKSLGNINGSRDIKFLNRSEEQERKREECVLYVY